MKKTQKKNAGTSCAEREITYEVRNTPIGEVTVVSDETAILRIHFGQPEPEHPEIYGVCRKTELTDRAFCQLTEYGHGIRTRFELPLCPHGTPFQQKVWDALLTIPYGETRTYGQIAAQVGNPKACRAVGMANHVNPIAIVIPCHRVIGANGSLTGYAEGLEVKRFLLQLEQTTSAEQTTAAPSRPASL